MCKIICLLISYVVYINSIYVFGFNESVADLIKNVNSAPNRNIADLSKKRKYVPRFEVLKHANKKDDDEEDEDDKEEEDDDDEKDSKEDSVDTQLNEAEERHSEEEKMLEDAEDVGLKESIDEEKAESTYASEATESDNKKNNGQGNGSLRYLMDQMVKLSVELKAVNDQINLMA